MGLAVEQFHTFGIPLLFGVLSVSLLLSRIFPARVAGLLKYWWFLSGFLLVSQRGFYAAAVWMFSLLCFWALREYLSFVDVRIHDRLGMFGAYLTIPFTIYFMQIGWYPMFLIAVPVYGFLVIPLLVALGRNPRGILVSISLINYGIFLFVYCLGHVGYLARYGAWFAALPILMVMVCDLCHVLPWRLGRAGWVRVLLAMPVTVAISAGIGAWIGIPRIHGVVLGLLVPVLGAFGRYVSGFILEDIGVSSETIRPGAGQVLGSLQSTLYVGPVVFHYLQYFLKLESWLGG